MKAALRLILPPFMLLLLLLGAMLLPKTQSLQEAAISPQLVQEIRGWQASKTQESDKERQALAADTIFSKAIYQAHDKALPPINASIVYSGNDMNASIHRPERCLPAQGHIILQSSQETLSLKDGHQIELTRLESTSYPQKLEGDKLHHITYYLFVGHDSTQSTHLGRTICDIQQRIFAGMVQRWAYVQLSSYWGKSINMSKINCEKSLQELLQVLLPLLIKWQKIEG